MRTIAISSIRIKASIHDVFDFVVNMENYKQWFPGVIDIKSHNDLPHGAIGKTYNEMVKIPFIGKKETIIEVMKAEGNKQFITAANLPPLWPQMHISFSKNQNHTTRLTCTFNSRSKNRFFILLFLPFIKQDMQARANAGVLHLKKILEQ